MPTVDFKNKFLQFVNIPDNLYLESDVDAFTDFLANLAGEDFFEKPDTEKVQILLEKNSQITVENTDWRFYSRLINVLFKKTKEKLLISKNIEIIACNKLRNLFMPDAMERLATPMQKQKIHVSRMNQIRKLAIPSHNSNLSTEYQINFTIRINMIRRAVLTENVRQHMSIEQQVKIACAIEGIRISVLPENIQRDMSLDNQIDLVLRLLAARKKQVQHLPLETEQMGLRTTIINNEAELPEDLVCPLSLQLLNDPVMVITGNVTHYFSRVSIENALKIKKIHPLTNNPLSVEELIPAHDKALQVEAFKKEAQRILIDQGKCTWEDFGLQPADINEQKVFNDGTDNSNHAGTQTQKSNLSPTAVNDTSEQQIPPIPAKSKSNFAINYNFILKSLIAATALSLAGLGLGVLGLGIASFITSLTFMATLATLVALPVLTLNIITIVVAASLLITAPIVAAVGFKAVSFFSEKEWGNPATNTHENSY